MFINNADLEDRARRIRALLSDMRLDDAGSVALAVAAEKALAIGISPERFGHMAETLAHALTMKTQGGES
jgi:hypothetical protein